GSVTGDGGKHAGKTIKILSNRGSFHGRTTRPAQASDSIAKNLVSLASFRDRKNLLTTEPNNVADLKKVFEQAKKDNVYIEAMFMEPVMGEGNPGLSISPEFYKAALDLCHEHDALLIVDSVQAGLRAHGVLSIVDYPGFEKLPAPDIESYSKAINAGQYPLSVLALTERTAALYKPGVYGNTMTTNPRALHTAVAVMEQITPELSKNIRERGREMLQKLGGLQQEFPDKIVSVRGTGLLLCAELIDGIPVTGPGNIEQLIRTKGVNVVHGGKNALRFTPSFKISSQEIDLMIEVVREALREFKAKSA
ncbi:MAG: aminotransferase class III-fold pyridoxal phosphate-dependent enzyme, partial [Bdellovibrionales bacterium]|nr:aminotransferase class III-fold pyridoxal phosphate-dependent enzyme [Bdellovibrionales bacterium]